MTPHPPRALPMLMCSRRWRLRVWPGLLVGLLLLSAPAFAQTMPAHVAEQPAPQATKQVELQTAEKELTNRLVDLNKAKEAEGNLRQKVEEARDALEEARATLRAAAVREREAALRAAEEALARAVEQRATLEKLYDQEKKKFQIAKERVELAAKKTEAPPAPEAVTTPIEEAIQRKTRVQQAKKEASLAKEKTATLREQLETLLKRQRSLRPSIDQISRRLYGSPRLAGDEWDKLWNEQQNLLEEVSRVSEQIQQVRHELVLAEATQLIKEGGAKEEAASYQRWKRDLMLIGALFLVAVLLVIVIRRIIARRIVEPRRRYLINKLLSLITTGVILLGLAIIFANRLSNVLTLFGFAVAGLAIALQEIVASFAAWFFIRGPRGYRNRDWIQVGDQCGEVVDIGFLRTTLQQAAPLGINNPIEGGTYTGGLVVLMNNAVFKHPLINYTRGFPFVWCHLRFTLTYESDWEKARDLMLRLMLEEAEIVHSAERAMAQISEMAGAYVIRVDSTQPLVRAMAAADGVELALRFLAHPRRRASLLDKINTKVMRAVLASEKMQFAYHTVRSIATPLADQPLTAASDGAPEAEAPRVDVGLPQR